MITSCNEDFFTNELEVDLIEQEDLMNIVAIISSDSNSLDIAISNTRAVNSEVDFIALNDADIELYADDLFVGNVPAIDDGVYQLINETLFSSSASSYELRVRHEDYPDASAQMMAPLVVPLTEVVFDITEEELSPNFIVNRIKAEVSFDDPVGDNYYAFRATGSQGAFVDNLFLESDFNAI